MARRKGIALDGVLLLDKPAGWSSNRALGRAKHLFGAQKAGHTGTLDPFATGLLPVCLGEATKFSSDLLEADKTYEAVAELGATTRTGDIEGEVLERRPVSATVEDIGTALAGLLGEIEQVPPMYSALKRDGKPLYELARAGIEVERAPRTVFIYVLELLSWDAPHLRFRVRCSKGTYVRTLAEQIGQALGCGAHLQALRRTGIGRFGLEGAVTLEELEACAPAERSGRLLGADALVAQLPALHLEAGLSARLMQGQRLALEQPPARYRVYGPGEVFLGTAGCDGHVLAPERLVAVPAKDID
jgi:tRNA pseudouridine55 synthase